MNSMHSLPWLSYGAQLQSYDDAWWCHLFTFLLHITGYQYLHTFIERLYLKQWNNFVVSSFVVYCDVLEAVEMLLSDMC